MNRELFLIDRKIPPNELHVRLDGATVARIQNIGPDQDIRIAVGGLSPDISVTANRDGSLVTAPAPSETPEPTPDEVLRVVATELMRMQFAWEPNDSRREVCRSLATAVNTVADSLPSLIAAKQRRDELERELIDRINAGIELHDKWSRAESDRSQLRAAIEALPTFYPNYEYDSGTSMQHSPSGNGEWVELAAVLSLMEPAK